MKVLIFGYGQMGRMIADVMHTYYGAEVVLVDTLDIHKGTPFTMHVGDCADSYFVRRVIEKESPNVVVSSLPYFLNLNIATLTSEWGVPYVDLGGSVPVSEQIKDITPNSAILTDMGLAPGLVNMWAEELYHDMSETSQVYSVHMRVGGLPETSRDGDPILHYMSTWSNAGLINEYKDDCEIISCGQLVTTGGMTAREEIDSVYECFHTSGGMAHSLVDMKERDVQNCTYKTIRYHGHKCAAQALMRAGVLDTYLRNMTTSCHDKVIIMAELENYRGDILHREKVFTGHEKWSAMQMCTGIPVAVAAHTLGRLGTMSLHLTYMDLFSLNPGFNQNVQDIIDEYI